MLDQPVVQKDFAAVFCQKGDDFEFILGQMDLGSVAQNLMLFKINRQPLRMIGAVGKRRRSACGCCAAGQSVYAPAVQNFQTAL